MKQEGISNLIRGIPLFMLHGGVLKNGKKAWMQSAR
jgi:hypothetical protein